MRGRSLVWSCLIATIATVPFTFAFRDGAQPGRTGGPLGAAGNCTECHGYNAGDGAVALFGVDSRYIPGALYGLTVRISDEDELGAGFEISAEQPTRHVGTFQLADIDRTRFSGHGNPDPSYVTHTLDGLLDSVETWAANGHSASFPVFWLAPELNEGPVTFFGAAIAMNNNEQQVGDMYYATHTTLQPAEPYDADGDTDGDLRDAAVLLRCFGKPVFSPLDPCAYVDQGDHEVTLSDWVSFASLFDGPTALDPAGYVLADAVRGGLMYDRWWRINGAPVPEGDHPLWATRPDQVSNTRTGSTTFRCKECHGWDYKGVLGAYGIGDHRTGFPGILGTTKTPQELFNLLKADPNKTPNGHDMDEYGMSDDDIWDVVNFSLKGVVDTDNLIDGKGSYVGNELFGSFLFTGACSSCHGEQGDAINFGSEEDPEYVGGISRANPWEVLHKVRFGQPGAPMQGAELLGWVEEIYANVGAFCQTLP